MAKLICTLHGVRGRILRLYDTKCVIETQKTAGSLITGNFTDGEKTIFLCDVVGVQFKKSGALVGYLQFETPSMQMNNQNNNMFSENTFTFEDGVNGVTNSLMISVYSYITDRIEELKYGTSIIHETPDLSPRKPKPQNYVYRQPQISYEVPFDQNMPVDVNDEDTDDTTAHEELYCFGCGELLSYSTEQTKVRCPWCNTEMTIK